MSASAAGSAAAGTVAAAEGASASGASDSGRCFGDAAAAAAAVGVGPAEAPLRCSTFSWASGSGATRTKPRSAQNAARSAGDTACDSSGRSDLLATTMTGKPPPPLPPMLPACLANSSAQWWRLVRLRPSVTSHTSTQPSAPRKNIGARALWRSPPAVSHSCIDASATRVSGPTATDAPPPPSSLPPPRPSGNVIWLTVGPRRPLPLPRWARAPDRGPPGTDALVPPSGAPGEDVADAPAS
mmetsp:Transcript_25718/g.79330  ORF Transcript_25718/g.79330 Transcript_25718/m.79330 type:complete len:241 (+) Transcript_25718:664-1386(+)